MAFVFDPYKDYEYMRPKDVQKYLGISRRLLNDLVQEGQLKSFRWRAGGERRFLREQVVELLRSKVDTTPDIHRDPDKKIWLKTI